MFFRFIFYSILFYLIISLLRKIKIYIKNSSKNSDINTNYKRSDFRKAQKREIIDAEYEDLDKKK